MHITKTPTLYQNTHTLPKHPRITKIPTHYQNTHTLPKHPHFTKTPTHYQNTHALPKHPHFTKTPTHYQNTHALPKHPRITRTPTPYQNTHTFQVRSDNKQCEYISLIIYRLEFRVFLKNSISNITTGQAAYRCASMLNNLNECYMLIYTSSPCFTSILFHAPCQLLF
jgi:hypothetical protein